MQATSFWTKPSSAKPGTMLDRVCEQQNSYLFLGGNISYRFHTGMIFLFLPILKTSKEVPAAAIWLGSLPGQVLHCRSSSL